MDYQESEIFVLLMAAVLTPLIIVALRSVRIAGRRWFLLGYFAMMAAYVFTVAEGYLPLSEAFNLAEHLMYALSGIGFAGGTWSVLVEARRRRSA